MHFKWRCFALLLQNESRGPSGVSSSPIDDIEASILQMGKLTTELRCEVSVVGGVEIVVFFGGKF